MERCRRKNTLHEVLEMISEVCLLLWLSYFAWEDYHTKTVNVIAAIVAAVIGVILRLLQGNREICLGEILAGVSVGMVLLFISYLTKENVGRGDGILFMVTGCYLDCMKNVILLIYTFLIVGGFCVICVITKRLGKTDSVPMIPFMLLAFVILKM